MSSSSCQWVCRLQRVRMIYAAAVHWKQKSRRTGEEIMNLHKLRQLFSRVCTASYNNKRTWDGIMSHIREAPGICSETSKARVRLIFKKHLCILRKLSASLPECPRAKHRPHHRISSLGQEAAYQRLPTVSINWLYRLTLPDQWTTFEATINELFIMFNRQ